MLLAQLALGGITLGVVVVVGVGFLIFATINTAPDWLHNTLWIVWNLLGWVPLFVGGVAIMIILLQLSF